MKALEDLSASKLHRGEQAVVREAADELLFCKKLEGDAAAEEALAALSALLDRLVHSERLLAGTAERLSGAMGACGSQVPVGA